MIFIHVSISGSDFSGQGTPSQPLRTVQEALRRAEEVILSPSPDDVTIKIDVDGMYDPFVLTFMAFTTPVEPANRLSIRADIGLDVEFDGKCIIEGQKVDVSGVSFSSENDDALQLWNVSDSTLSDCKFSSATMSGLHLSGSGTNLKIDASKFNGSSIGLEIDSAADYRLTDIINNQMHDNSIGVKMGSFGSVNLSLNTIAYNVDGLQIGDINQDELENFVSSNIVTFNSNGVVFKNGNESLLKTRFVNNNVFGNTEDYSGIANQSGIYDNFSVDPLFVDGSLRNFYLQSTSPCIGMATTYFENVRDFFNENRYNKLATSSDIGSLNNTVGVVPLTPLQINDLMLSTHVDHWFTRPDMTLDSAALKRMQLINADIAYEEGPDGSQNAFRLVPKGNDADAPAACEIGSKYHLETFSSLNPILFDYPPNIVISGNRAQWSPLDIPSGEFDVHPVISLKPAFITSDNFDFQVDVFKYSLSANFFGRADVAYAKLLETGNNFSISLYFDDPNDRNQNNDPNEHNSSRQYYWEVKWGSNIIFQRLLDDQTHAAGFAGRVRMKRTGTSIHFYINGEKVHSALYPSAMALAQLTCDGLHIAEFANFYISMANGIPLPNNCLGQGHKGISPSIDLYRDSFTVMLWLKNPNFNGVPQRIFEILGNDGGSSFTIDFPTPTSLVVPGLGPIPTGDITSGGFNGWHNFVITRRLDRILVYQNKVLIADMFDDTLWGGGDLVICEESGAMLFDIKIQRRYLELEFVEFYYDNVVLDQGTIVLP